MQKKGKHIWASKPLAYMLYEIQCNDKLTPFEAQCRLIEHAMVGRHIEKVSIIGQPVVQSGFEKDKKKKKLFFSKVFI